MATFVFCDEYGNTGGNLVDRDQRIFAYAFFIVQAAALDGADRLLAEICRDPGRAELKSGRLAASRKGRQTLAAIGAAMVKLGARIVLSVVEKRYQICSLIVETYLDPVYCEGALPDMIHAGARQRFADACYDVLDDPTLAAFLNAVRADDVAELSCIGDQISSRLRFHPDDLVYRAAPTMATDPGRVFRHCVVRDDLPIKFSPTSHYAAFYPGLKKVDAILASQGETGTVIRDNDSQHGPFLDLVFSTGRDLEGTPLEAVYGAQRLECLLECEPVNSSTSVGVQVADLAAGAFGRAIQASIVARRLTQDANRLAEAWRPMLVPRNAHYLAVSDAQLTIVEETIFGAPQVP